MRADGISILDFVENVGEERTAQILSCFSTQRSLLFVIPVMIPFN